MADAPTQSVLRGGTSRIVDPIEETLSVQRWHRDGYVEVVIADRDEKVPAEPFEAIEFRVAMLFGEDDDEP